jgi:hypothetical protein
MITPSYLGVARFCAPQTPADPSPDILARLHLQILL